MVALTYSVYGQKAKDYFLPAPPNNKTFYYMPHDTGQTNVYKSRLYIRKSDGCEITEAYYSKDILPEDVIYIGEKVEFTDKDVLLAIHKTNFDGSSYIYRPRRKILSLPPFGKSLTWSYIDDWDKKVIITTDWVTEDVKGIKKQVLRKMIKNSTNDNTYMVDYYAPGIGLWRNEIWNKEGNEFKKIVQYSFEEAIIFSTKY